MKLKKEYIVLLLVIVALSLYLTMRSKDQTHFELPRLDSVESKSIDRLVIARTGETIELTRKDDKWYLVPKDYPADGIKANNMVKAAADLTVTALVSESKNYERYDLNDHKKIHLQAMAGKTVLRNVDIGRLAPTNQHTFVKLEGDPRVYHARGNMRRTFDQTVAELRDETVLNFEKDAITGLRIEKGDHALALTKKEKEKPAEEKKEAETSSPPAKPEIQWQDKEGRPAKNADVAKVLNSFFQVKCDGYMADDAKQGLQDPLWTVTFEADGKTFLLSVFAPATKEAEEYPAISSGTPYAFLLNKGRVETLIKQLDALLGSEDGKKDGGNTK